MGYKKQMAKVLFPLMANWDWARLCNILTLIGRTAYLVT